MILLYINIFCSFLELNTKVNAPAHQKKERLMSRGSVLPIITIILVCCLAGCSAAVKMAPTPDDSAPAWARGEQTYISDGYVYVVGMSEPMGNVSLAKRIAEENGRSRLLLFLKNEPLINGQRFTVADMSWVEVPKLVYSMGNKRAYSLVRCKLPEK